jgi:two-component system, NarL family, response regulator YdfI
VIRVSVVASSEIVRAGLVALLRGSPSISVVGSHSSLAGIGEEEDGSVILFDVDANAEEGAPGVSIILTDAADPSWLAGTLRSGTKAILPRNASGPEIMAAIEGVAAGLVVLHPESVQSVLPMSASSERALPPTPQHALTPREIEVLGMLAEGQGNKAIAWKLNISEHTVKFHVSSVFSKLNVSSRTEAVTIGIRLGLIML